MGRQSQRFSVRSSARHTKQKLERFLSRLGLKVEEIQAALVPAYKHWTRPWRRISGLVGDAAAQVKVTTAGGLVTGLHGAKAAANAILHRTECFEGIRTASERTQPPPAYPHGFESLSQH